MANKLSPFKQMRYKTEAYKGNLTNWIRDGEGDKAFDGTLKKILTAQQEINSIVQEALKDKSSNGGRKKYRKKRTRGKLRAKFRAKSRKKRAGVRRRRRQYHPLETLASNEMLELFRNPGNNEYVPTAMNRCRSEDTKGCLSELLNARELPHSKSDFTDEQLEIYNGIIETCKPKDIVVPWNTQSGEGHGGGRKKKTRKKRRKSRRKKRRKSRRRKRTRKRR